MFGIFLFDFLGQIDIVSSAQKQKKLNKKNYKIMKTKVFLLLVVISLMSIRLSAGIEQVYLAQGQPQTHYYFCESIIDSVVVYAPETPEEGGFSGPGPYVNADSVIIVPTNQGFWSFETASFAVEFYIHFVSIAPTEPFASEELYKCPETSLVIPGQSQHQPDFTYLWGAGETTQSLQLLIPGNVFVTVTGACGEVTDYMEVLNWPSPDPNLGADMFTCNGNIIILDPGTFAAYSWTDESSNPTLEVSTTDTYGVTVTDANGCQETDDVFIEFTTNPGQEILLVTIDTINGNNMVIWEVVEDAYLETRIYRETSTDIYEQVGTTTYIAGSWTDDVSSTNQAFRYKIMFLDTCNNLSPLSNYHQTISTATVPIVGGGYRVEWTPYLIQDGEKGTRSVSNYYLFAVQGLGINWNAEQLAQVSGNVTEYNLPIVDDSMFVVGAELGGTKAGVSGLALSNLVNNPLLAVPHILAEDINIYPNPSTGVFFVEGGDRVEVYNSIGQLVMSKSVDQLTSIEITAGAGLYIVKVYDRTQVIVSNKISIQ